MTRHSSSAKQSRTPPITSACPGLLALLGGGVGGMGSGGPLIKKKKKRQRSVLQAPNQPQSGTETPGAPCPANRGSIRDPGETCRARYARFCLAAPVRGGRTSRGFLLGHGEFHFSAAKQKAARGLKMDALILNSPPTPPQLPTQHHHPIPHIPPSNNRIFF